MTAQPYAVARLSEIGRSGSKWVPVRRHFDIRAFGVNAWVGDEPGDNVIDEHRESGGGHEELYVVLAGRATFTVAGEKLDAPVGTLVFVQPGVLRAAVAAEPGTTVLAVGAKPGEAFQISAWELWLDALPYYEAKEYDRAAEVILRQLEQHPDEPTLLYNLACVESLAGRHDDALEHLGRAIPNGDRFAELARTDTDFDPIRDRPEFAELVQ
jgi:tetratricopeptide (TPR) repeat protein